MAKTYNFKKRDISYQFDAHESVLLAEMAARGDWEPHLFQIFDAYLRPTESLLDLGAFIGTSALYGAHLAKHCYAVEPNPLSFTYLKRNAAMNKHLNRKMTLFEGCLWRENGQCQLTAPVKPHGSAASVRRKSGPASWEVEAVTFGKLFELLGIQDLNFIKMDIEGSESIVLPTMKDYLRAHRPTVLVSIHAFNYKDPRRELADVVDSLAHYRFLMRRDGMPLDVNAVLNGVGVDTPVSENSDILASDEAWARTVGER